MRVALVSPYSWTYPGGVTRHIEALAERFVADGHDVRVLAPLRSRRSPLGGAAPWRGAAAPRAARLPDPARAHDRLPGERRRLEPVVARRRPQPDAPRAARRRLRRRPPARAGRAGAVLGRAASTRLPLVGTFHSYSTNRLTNNVANLLGARRLFNHLHVRIAVSEAAAWTARALLRRPLPDRPERRRRARRGAPRAARARPSRCGSCSSARRSSARACRCCCARSRRCASTSRSS